MGRCPTCGQAVKVFTGSEGTSSFEKLAERQVEEAREALTDVRGFFEVRGSGQAKQWCERIDAVLARLSLGEEGTDG